MGTSAATNFNSFEIAQTGVTSVGATASTNNWVTVAHNLGYTPRPAAYLDGVNLGSIFSNGIMPLPTFINSSISGGVYQFNSYMYVGADSTNVYFILINATGVPISAFPVKYYLERERAR
jgi:hypothetical protein